MSTEPLAECRVRSHELIQSVIVEKELVKQVPRNGRPAQSTVYQWARPPRSAGGTGSQNPLDLVERLIEVANMEGKIEIANWICFAANGFFIPAPSGEDRDASALFKHSNQLTQEYAAMVQTLAKTAEDGIIESHEAKQIRNVWQKIQSKTEGYVRQCERGEFDPSVKNKERRELKLQTASPPSAASAA